MKKLILSVVLPVLMLSPVIYAKPQHLVADVAGDATDAIASAHSEADRSDTIQILAPNEKYDFQAGDSWDLLQRTANAEFYESEMTMYIAGSEALEAWIKRVDKNSKAEVVTLYQLRCEGAPKVALLEQYQLNGSKTKLIAKPSHYRELLPVSSSMEEAGVFKKLCVARKAA